jgi:hypothetical protein
MNMTLHDNCVLLLLTVRMYAASVFYENYVGRLLQEEY